MMDVVSASIALAQHCQVPPPMDTKIKVIMAPDATRLWRTSATRCMVYVHVWPPLPIRGCKTVGHIVGP